MDKRGAIPILIGAILIILADGHDFNGFIFTVLYIQLSCLLFQKQVYISPSDFYLGICNVKSD